MRCGVSGSLPPGTRTCRAASSGCGDCIGRNAIETRPEGYRLALGNEQVDAGRFERMVHRARELVSLGEADRARYLLDEALDLWRGDALADLGRLGPGEDRGRTAEGLRLDAEEMRLDAALRSGEHDRVITDLTALVRAQPLRERRWALLALAQYQAGRQAEALRTLREVRSLLARELGLDPGPDLVALERAILTQDPSVAGPTPMPAVDAVPTPACSPTRSTTPTSSSVVSTMSLPAWIGCGRRESWPSWARRAAASRPWSGPDWRRHCSATGHRSWC